MAPQHIDHKYSSHSFAVAAGANTVTAVSLARGTRVATYEPETNAGRFSQQDETDQAAMSTRDTNISANAKFEVSVPNLPMADEDRACGYNTVATQPADEDTVTVVDTAGPTTVIFEFDSGGGVTGTNTAVTIGGTTAATATNMAAALAASALDLEADANTRTTNRIDWISKTQGGTFTFTPSNTTKYTTEDLGSNRVIHYLASGVGSTVINVLTEG